MTNSDFINRVKPITLSRYQKILRPFTTWAVEERLDPVTASDWDDALLDYKALHPAELTKAKFVMLVAAVEFYIPMAKRQLVWCRSFIVG